MKSALVGLVSAAIIVFLGLFASATSQGWTVPLICGERDTSGDRVSDPEMQRAEQLQAKGEQMRHRLRTRQWVVVELIDQRITLFEAAAHFRILDATLPAQWLYRQRLRDYYPGKSDEERLCHRVIEQIQLTMYDRPALAGAITRRLQRELSNYLKLGRSVHLPQVRSPGLAQGETGSLIPALAGSQADAR